MTEDRAVHTLKLSDYVSDTEDFHYVFYDHYNPDKVVKHNHDYYELMLITKNSLVQTINDEKMVLEAGHICFVRPEDVHSFEFNGKEICNFINLSFRQSLLMDMLEYMGKEKFEWMLEEQQAPLILVSPNRMSELKTQLIQLNELHADDVEMLNLSAKVVLVNIFSSFYTQKKDQLMSVPGWLKKTMYSMQEKDNFMGGIKRMNEIACVSPEHLSRAFRQYTNQTPTQFLTSVRLQYAVNLLIRTDTPINDIAYELGFSSAAHFYGVFKKVYQCTPLQFRKNRMVLKQAMRHKPNDLGIHFDSLPDYGSG